jgi:4-hydroxybenzoate polyprenyltransferase
MWPFVIMNCAAYGFAVAVSISDWVAITLATCACMSISFAVNDIVDVDIDRVNGKRRWHPQTAMDLSRVAIWLLIMLILVYGAAIIVGGTAQYVIFGTLAGCVVYSFGPKSLPGVGNALAALLAVSPVIAFIAASPMDEMRLSPYQLQAILVAGFITFFCREIRYDLFDAPGDRAGGRATYPIVFSTTICHVLCGALFLFSIVLLVRVAFLTSDSLERAIWLGAAFIYAALTTWYYVAMSESTFTLRTRVFMLLWPSIVFMLALS